MVNSFRNDGRSIPRSEATFHRLMNDLSDLELLSSTRLRPYHCTRDCLRSDGWKRIRDLCLRASVPSTRTLGASFATPRPSKKDDFEDQGPDRLVVAMAMVTVGFLEDLGRDMTTLFTSMI